MTKTGVSVELRGLARYYGKIAALKPSDLIIGAGEFVTLLGPSGSGKSTMLHLVAGYVSASEGRVFLGGNDVTPIPARRRNIGMVFQNYALFPHMTVGENVGYGLRVRGWPRAKVEKRVIEVLEVVRLGGFAQRAVTALSGGQQQRVALARALAIEPDLILMDEPLGALDRQLRRNVQFELRRLHEAHGRTTIYVTHDQEEALILSDRIAVMRDGRIEQLGTAEELYKRPANAFIAAFVGESNLLPAKVKTASNGTAEIEVPGVEERLTASAAEGVAVGRDARLLLRPEELRICEKGALTAHVTEQLFLGELVALRLSLPHGDELWLRQKTDPRSQPGDTVRIGWKPDAQWIVPVN